MRITHAGVTFVTQRRARRPARQLTQPQPVRQRHRRSCDRSPAGTGAHLPRHLIGLAQSLPVLDPGVHLGVSLKGASLARSKSLEAGPVTLLEILQSKHEYTSPLFQRRYVWGKKEISKLWEDIDEVLDGQESSRFLGALVLEVKSSGLAFQVDSSWIIDGQQRLTTLYIALLKIAKLALEINRKDLASSIVEDYLLNTKGSSKNAPKLVPTLPDYAQFNELFQPLADFEPNLRASYGQDDKTLSVAAKTIESEIRKRALSEGSIAPDRLIEISSTVLQKLKFVQISLGDSEDPHQVFDSLNGRGVRLENKDLIRNIVFQRLAANPSAASSLYNQSWLPFEADVGEHLEAYFFPFALLHSPSTTKSTLLADLRDRWMQYEPPEIMRDLKSFVPYFLALVDPAMPRSWRTEDDELSEAVARLHRMNAPSSVLPFCLRVLEGVELGALAGTTATQNLLMVESFLVRRAFAGLEPTGLHAVFKDLWEHTGGDPFKAQKRIDDNKTVRFPSDEEFEWDIKNRALYGRKLARYIVLEYERAQREGDPLPDIQPKDVTLDHIVPQALTPEWLTAVDENEHEKLVDTWANLVPLSGRANSQKGQQSWLTVREFFRNETIYKSTKRIASRNEQWNMESVTIRAQELSDWALRRWPRLHE